MVLAAVLLGSVLGTGAGLAVILALCKCLSRPKDNADDPTQITVTSTLPVVLDQKPPEPVQPPSVPEEPLVCSPRGTLTATKLLTRHESTAETDDAAAAGGPRWGSPETSGFCGDAGPGACGGRGSPAGSRQRGAERGDGRVDSVEGKLRQGSCNTSASAAEQQPPGESEETEVWRSKGKLHFSLKYNEQMCELRVVIIEASGIPKTDKAGFCDPFVVLSLYTKTVCQKGETSVKQKTVHPVWNEAFTFNLTCEELTDSTLILSLYDFDKFSRCNFVGDIRLKLADVDVHSGRSTSVDLKALERDGDINVGELLFAIGYLPTANRLVVVLMKARSLNSGNLKDCADLSVKMSLWHQGTRMKKKQTKRVKYKLNPVWNEVVMFEVPFEQLQNVSLELALVNYDRSGRAAALGRCLVGARAGGLEGKHWEEMVNNPRKQIAMWHLVN
uniref:Synaptotagmin-13 isoform X2 n=1 Tax=Petromyzon marinus TaxID=7757 RepID=A0AAJ7TDJ7_PETMA|nr:synaptotagmin-13 isoform X2 [Petromyzon marinus]